VAETDVEVRPLAPDDAPAVGRLHVRAWQAAYRGIMPDDFLDGLRADDREAMWRRIASEPPARSFLFVVERDAEVVGFASVGPANPPTDGDGIGELYAINVDPDAWGSGAGAALLVEATDGLRRLGFEAAVLWVLPANQRARRFYERNGWSATGEEKIETLRAGVTVRELLYRRPL
jgi:ribosomal protein S18 acetylase RimI-like enzyme